MNLSFSHQKDRVDFCLEQVSPDRRTYKTCADIIYVDETWYYVVHARKKVRMFPGEEKGGSINGQHESTIPKVIFISGSLP